MSPTTSSTSTTTSSPSPESPVLPVLDLSEAADPQRAADFREALLDATVNSGFFYLVGHGVPIEQRDGLLDVARRFFALPDEDKRAIEALASPHFRGWTRLGGELTQGRTDWREQIDLGTERPAVPATDDEPWNILEGPNQWPAALPQLKDVATAWTERLTDVAETLLHQWALALGQPEDVFDAAFEEPSTLLKIVRYPAAEGPSDASGEDDFAQGVGAHKDSGVLTLLLPEPGSEGLQVQLDGRWVDAPPLEGALVVNIGELLEVATNGLLRATVHRVVSPNGQRERLSVPFFYNPSLGARIPQLDLPAPLRERAPGVTTDATNVLHDTYGGNALKSRLRAHPDIAARHHPELLARAS